MVLTCFLLKKHFTVDGCLETQRGISWRFTSQDVLAVNCYRSWFDGWCFPQIVAFEGLPSLWNMMMKLVGDGMIGGHGHHILWSTMMMMMMMMVMLMILIMIIIMFMIVIMISIMIGDCCCAFSTVDSKGEKLRESQRLQELQAKLGLIGLWKKHLEGWRSCWWFRNPAELTSWGRYFFAYFLTTGVSTIQTLVGNGILKLQQYDEAM